MSTYRVTTVCLVEAESEEEALERESIEGGDIQSWYAETVEDEEDEAPGLTCWCGEGVTPNPTYDLDPEFRYEGQPYAPWLHVADPETGEAPADDEHEAIPTPESIQRSIA